MSDTIKNNMILAMEMLEKLVNMQLQSKQNMPPLPPPPQANNLQELVIDKYKQQIPACNSHNP